MGFQYAIHRNIFGIVTFVFNEKVMKNANSAISYNIQCMSTTSHKSQNYQRNTMNIICKNITIIYYTWMFIRSYINNNFKNV